MSGSSSRAAHLFLGRGTLWAHSAFEPKVPTVQYEKHNEFVCGILFRIHDFDYFAPVSSFRKAQHVYETATSGKDPHMAAVCCDFKKLEAHLREREG